MKSPEGSVNRLSTGVDALIDYQSTTNFRQIYAKYVVRSHNWQIQKVMY